MTLVKLSSSAAQSGRNDNNSSFIIIQYRSIARRGQFIVRPRSIDAKSQVGISVSTLRNGTNRVAIYVYILETVKINHRPSSVGDGLSKAGRAARLGLFSGPAVAFHPFQLRRNSRRSFVAVTLEGRSELRKSGVLHRSTIDRVISVITPSLVMENAVSPVISRQIEIFHEYPRRNRPVVILLRSHIITTGVGTIIRRELSVW